MWIVELDFCIWMPMIGWRRQEHVRVCLQRLRNGGLFAFVTSPRTRALCAFLSQKGCRLQVLHYHPLRAEFRKFSSSLCHKEPRRGIKWIRSRQLVQWDGSIPSPLDQRAPEVGLLGSGMNSPAVGLLEKSKGLLVFLLTSAALTPAARRGGEARSKQVRGGTTRSLTVGLTSLHGAIDAIEIPLRHWLSWVFE